MPKPIREKPCSLARPAACVELDQAVFFLGRAFYSYIGVLDRILVEAGLDGHVRPGMGNVLFALFERDDQTISEVAARLRLSKSTMTDMVARIRKSGLITAKRDPADGRAIRLRLTPLARSLEPRCRKAARRMDDIACRRFNDEERNVLRDLLGRMIESMSEELERSRRDSQA
ncbi:MAG: MarR family transcriptional regulator [Planctomycetaceae bacterium]|nr:MarR family transcriptional regulator [Planctomycetaceae bacterium]